MKFEINLLQEKVLCLLSQHEQAEQKINLEFFRILKVLDDSETN